MTSAVNIGDVEAEAIRTQVERIVNANVSDYLVPVNADVATLDAVFLPAEDKIADPIGVKGLGEHHHQHDIAPADGNDQHGRASSVRVIVRAWASIGRPC